MTPIDAVIGETSRWIDTPAGWATLADIGGCCPVQASGRVQRTGGPELAWYYRARHGRFTLDIGPSTDDGTYCRYYVDEHDAVWSDWGTDPARGWASVADTAPIVHMVLMGYIEGRDPREAA